ncbi:DUF1127 domain-containing protein [uncultured Aliiroseovarius sp.]|uniref:DUF1127 domain-containing protein n=1 Tax=uncultured Aliiroseovarius sp. TaxID=1658783 RepID=UPI0034248C42
MKTAILSFLGFPSIMPPDQDPPISRSEMRRQGRALLSLDERTLKDIGVTQSMAHDEARRIFRRD